MKKEQKKQEKTLTIAELARLYKRDRSTVLRWVEKKLFPNAVLIESPVNNYWKIPVSDTIGFVPPVRGPKKSKGAANA